MILSEAQARAEVTLSRHGRTVHRFRGPHCPRCDSEMELHQPDAQSPDRLLGTCPECAQWLIIDSESRSFSWFLEIPSPAEMRELSTLGVVEMPA